MPEKKLILPNDGSNPIGAYSPALEYGDLIFISGQIPIDVDSDIETQTKQCLDKIKNLLLVKGLEMDNILRCEVFLKDLSDFSEFNQVYAEFFNKPYPTRYAIGGLQIPKNFKIEISAIASK